MPLATDICQAGADLMWGEAPSFTVADEPTQARLDDLIDDGALLTFASGAESGGALGGHFLRVTWDAETEPDRPFLTVVDADGAVPDFRWGRLVGVTFWTALQPRPGETDPALVWRYLERHETLNGDGVIRHGLYRGTGTDLGALQPLDAHPATAPLAGMIDTDGDAISSGSPGLCVVYVPNRLPQRVWRDHTVGRYLGRSDLSQIEGVLDALDEVYSSWMRDIRLGKARLIAPATMLTDNGPGGGTSFDLDREVYEGVNAPPSSIAAATTVAQAEQFAIRHEEHRATATDLIETALRTAGLSPATFGIGSDGAPVTATEVTAREKRSYDTRDMKLRAARGPIAAILTKLLYVDKVIFGTPITPARPDVEFPDGVRDSTLALAQTAQALRAAEAASTEVLVRMLHPEWDTEQVAAEVEAIRAESALPALPDPASTVPGS